MQDPPAPTSHQAQPGPDLSWQCTRVASPCSLVLATWKGGGSALPWLPWVPGPACHGCLAPQVLPRDSSLHQSKAWSQPKAGWGATLGHLCSISDPFWRELGASRCAPRVPLLPAGPASRMCYHCDTWGTCKVCICSHPTCSHATLRLLPGSWGDGGKPAGRTLPPGDRVQGPPCWPGDTCRFCPEYLGGKSDWV